MGYAQDNDPGGNVLPPAATTRPCEAPKFRHDQASFEGGRPFADQPDDAGGMVTAVLPAKKARSGSHGYFTSSSPPQWG